MKTLVLLLVLSMIVTVLSSNQKHRGSGSEQGDDGHNTKRYERERKHEIGRKTESRRDGGHRKTAELREHGRGQYQDRDKEQDKQESHEGKQSGRGEGNEQKDVRGMQQQGYSPDRQNRKSSSVAYEKDGRESGGYGGRLEDHRESKNYHRGK